MNAIRLFASTMLASLVALPAGAQYLSPVAMRASDVTTALSRAPHPANSSVAAPRDTLPARPAAFSWRGTCGAIAGACTSIDPDAYPAGVTNAGPNVGDFWFRTYSSTDFRGFLSVPCTV